MKQKALGLVSNPEGLGRQPKKKKKGRRSSVQGPNIIQSKLYSVTVIDFGPTLFRYTVMHVWT